VDVSLESLGIVEALYEEHLFFQAAQRLEHFAELQVLAFAGGPPFLAVKSVACEEHAKADGRFAGGLAGCGSVAPNAGRFHPGQSHGHTDAAEKSSTI
jgi:hypothetical protein